MTPEELRQLLDSVVPPDSDDFGETNNDPFAEIAQEIARLPITPLSDEAFARIESRLMSQTQNLAAPPRSGGNIRPLWILAVIVVLVGVGIGGFFVLTAGGEEDENESPRPTHTLTLTRTASAEPTLTVTALSTMTLTASATQTPSRTATLALSPTGSASKTSVPTITPTLLPTIEASPTDLPIAMTIEGAVTAIEVNILTVYGIRIQLSPDDSILTRLEVGDMVRIEAAIGDDDLFVAVSIEKVTGTAGGGTTSNGGTTTEGGTSTNGGTTTGDSGSGTTTGGSSDTDDDADDDDDDD